MSKFKVQVCMTYVQIIEVEADSKYDAEVQALESFDIKQANQGEGECWLLDKGESK
jgi:hypothetical protein